MTKWLVATFAVLACGVLLIQALRAPSAAGPIKIILPDGYAGEFSIVKDRTIGRGLVRVQGVWGFEIPPSGILVVNDDAPFYEWHSQVVVDRRGRTILVRSLGTMLGQIKTGPNTSSASGEYDGTTHRWEVIPSSDKVRASPSTKTNAPGK